MLARRFTVLALAVSLSLAACGGGQLSRVNSYTPFGQFQPGEANRVTTEYAASLAQPAPGDDITILNATLPEGVSLREGALVIAPGAPYEAVGRFELGFRLNSDAPTEAGMVDYLKRFAHAAHANILIIQVEPRHDDPQRVAFVKGVALRKK